MIIDQQLIEIDGMAYCVIIHGEVELKEGDTITLEINDAKPE